MILMRASFAPLLLLFAGATAAQVAASPPPSNPPARPESVTAQTAAAPSAVSGFVSPFVRYRGFADEPVTSWHAANETVGRIGGWQAYGREAQRDLGAAPSAGATPAGAVDRIAPAAPPAAPRDVRQGARP